MIVVVSRWYGGIQLGPDRFKHINNVARLLLLNSGLVSKTTFKLHPCYNLLLFDFFLSRLEKKKFQRKEKENRKENINQN